MNGNKKHMKRYSLSLVIRAMQTEITRYPYLFKWLKLKRWTILSAKEDVEQMELSYTAGGNIK